MGNYKFRLSDMMPNAWFYKLKDMGGKGRDTTTNTNGNSRINSSTNSMERKPKASPAITTHPPPKPKQSSHNPYPRKSYYFTRELIPNGNTTLLNLPDPPRRSSKHRARRRTSFRSSPKLVSPGCSCGATLWTDNSKSENFPLSPPDHEDSIISPVEAETFEPFLFPPEFRSDGVLTTQSFDEMFSLGSKSCACKHETDNSSDIIIDVDKKSLARKPRTPLHPFDKVSELDLPRIVTKQVTQSDHVKEEETKKKQKDNSKELPPNKQSIKSATSKVVKQDQHRSSSNNSPRGRRYLNYSANSPGIRLRINSPRIASRRSVVHQHQVQGRKSHSLSSLSGSSRSSSITTTTTSSSSRRSLSASLAIVKSSFDPQRDFRESMVEMIVENNISASKDLEDLLACYLSLNSDEYHNLIIKVFKQIWFDFIHVNLN